MTTETLEDRVAGAMMGVIMGDAIGAPHEFRHGPRYQDGVISTLTVRSQYYRDRVAVKGQVTDDSEMTWALARSLISEGGYDEGEATKAYIAWANGLVDSPSEGRARKTLKKCYPPPPFMGNNTRRLFQGVRTVKGHLNRAQSRPSTESNGCMMRCIPLLFCPEEDLEADVRITNNNETCIEACLTLRNIFRGLIEGKDTKLLLEEIISERKSPVTRAISAGVKESNWDLISSKGWVGHPLYVLSLVLTRFGPTVKAMRATLVELNLIHRGCDSDTIGAIVLGVLGGVVGRERLLRSAFFKKAYETVVMADSTKGDLPRPAIYQPSGKGLGSGGVSFDELVEALVEVVDFDLSEDPSPSGSDNI